MLFGEIGSRRQIISQGEDNYTMGEIQGLLLKNGNVLLHCLEQMRGERDTTRPVCSTLPEKEDSQNYGQDR